VFTGRTEALLLTLPCLLKMTGMLGPHVGSWFKVQVIPELLIYETIHLALAYSTYLISDMLEGRFVPVMTTYLVV
jgi:hypothetical protein